MKCIDVKYFSKTYFDVKNLYQKAFPKEEQFPLYSLILSTLKEHIFFKAYYEDNIFCGIAQYGYNDSLLFLNFLAVREELRNKGYGSRIINLLKSDYPNLDMVIALEPIDEKAINYKQRLSRVKFYELNGLKLNDYLMIDKTGTYQIMNSNNCLDASKLESLIRSFGFGFKSTNIISK